MFTSTCWVYITHHLKAERPFLMYGLLTYFHYLPNTLFGLITANLHDKFRQTKLFMICINFVCLFGGIIYTIDVSTYFPITDCLLLGTRFFVTPIAVGELARSYAQEELTSKMPIMNFILYLGTGPASLSNFLSQHMNFNIGLIVIDYGNFLGLIMVIMYVTLQTLTLIFVQDISLEYDLKAHIEKEKYRESECLVEATDKTHTQCVKARM